MLSEIKNKKEIERKSTRVRIPELGLINIILTPENWY